MIISRTKAFRQVFPNVGFFLITYRFRYGFLIRPGPNCNATIEIAINPIDKIIIAGPLSVESLPVPMSLPRTTY